MSTHIGHTNGVDFMKHMQVGGDLQNAWIIFNHLNHVQGWIVMACHLYDIE
jgi:hypothetical protein